MIKFDGKKTGIFAAGVAFGTAGIKILTSKDAKKLYTNCTAAVLRAKACVMKTASTIQENAEDIYAEAQQINEEREAAEEETAEENGSKGENTQSGGTTSNTENTNSMKSNDINFEYTTNSGKLIKSVDKEWDKNVIIIVPLPNIKSRQERLMIENMIGNYLRDKNIPKIDLYSHNLGK